MRLGLELSGGRAPFYRKERTVATMMDDAAFCLLALLILPTIFYGIRPLITAFVSCGACFLAMVAFRLIHRRNISLSERSLFVTGLTVALLLPADIPYWMAALGGAFAIFVAKEPFGSTGRNPLNPAAAGVAFLTVLWPEEVFRFPGVGSLPLWGRGAEALPAQNPALSLAQGLRPVMEPMDMLWGRYAGPMGGTAALVIAGCCLFLCCRRTARWETTAGFLLSSALLAALWPRFLGSPASSAAYELLSGSLLFGAVFMISDPVTSPKMPVARFVYGLLGGALLLLMRHMGHYQEPLCFAVLLSNGAAPLLDRLALRIRTRGGIFRGKAFHAQ